MERSSPSSQPRRRIFQITGWVIGFLLVTFIFISELGLLPGNPKGRDHMNLLYAGVMIAFAMATGALFTLLLALLPPYKRMFWNRWVNRLPFGMVPVLLLAVIASAFSFFIWVFTGYEEVDETTVMQRPVPEAILCKQFHHGSFKVFNAEFERKGDIQIEYNSDRMATDTFNVHWPEPCTYILSKDQQDIMPVTVHITEVHADGYTCMRRRADEEIYKIRVHFQ